MTNDERRVSARGCDIRYLVAGAGQPVLAVHGGGGLHWTPWHQLLAAQLRVYAVEMPGFGQSTLSDQIRSIQDVADTVAEVAKTEGLERVGLIGESIGGLVSTWLTIRHPELVGRLLLESPAGFRLPSAKPRSEMTPDDVRKALYAHPERVPTGVGDPARQPRGFMPHLTDHGGWEDELKARLPEISIPTLILNGELDGLASPDNGRIYRATIPNACRILVEDAAHVIHLDQPELFNAIAVGFLTAPVPQPVASGVA
jgi:pimeloyl-ACP methyl ester carboxylesterase